MRSDMDGSVEHASLAVLVEAVNSLPGVAVDGAQVSDGGRSWSLDASLSRDADGWWTLDFLASACAMATDGLDEVSLEIQPVGSGLGAFRADGPARLRLTGLDITPADFARNIAEWSRQVRG
jgi:hypothetical protein